MHTVNIVDVSKTIGNRTILQNVNLSLDKGHIYGFFGRNGSGKTMLFRAICGLIKPTSGEIQINGKTLHKDISFPDSVGVIIESPGFWPYLTGLDNLKLLASIKNEISLDEIKQAITRVGLDPEDKRTFKKYSLGMKQRLGLAQALMEKPDLLVLDEPTNSLDEEGVELVRDILREEKARGATILIASHNKDDINLLSDQKFRISDGKVTPFVSKERVG
ncbi:ATP-binding cassette domain-containing protein [Numidum massiliense]|uniref:ATP-binding cassette domain-containing protein n=1 Tax=Numidum massiliense TaxID=1522315 RepID=UPI0006D52B76|nr:ATP-binding cassette domain-containing protein [Numidum massiliense]